MTQISILPVDPNATLKPLPEAESALQRAFELKLEAPDLLVLRYHLAALKGNKEQVNQVVALAKGKHGAEHCIAHAEALALARAGRLRPPAYHPTGPWTWPCKKGDAGRQQVTRRRERCAKAVYGNGRKKEESHGNARAFQGREVQYAAGLALAFSGESSRSEALGGDLEEPFPEDAFVKFTHAPHSVTRKALEIVRSHGFTS